MERVFLYGSLREGEYNFGRLGHQKPLYTTKTSQGYLLVSLGAYPAMVPIGDRSVVGEVHEIEDSQLPRFDAMEFGAGYTRELILLEDGKLVWGYVMPWTPWMEGRIVPSGDWKQRQRQGESQIF